MSICGRQQVCNAALRKRPRAARKSGLARLGVYVAIATLAVTVGGCATITAGHTVKPLSNRDTAELTAEQTVEIMLASGFSEQEIIANGPQLRNALAVSGAAQIRRGTGVDALYVVELGRIHVSARSRRPFIYDLRQSELQDF